jgi:hypothetical protein
MWKMHHMKSKIKFTYKNLFLLTNNKSEVIARIEVGQQFHSGFREK